MTKIKFWLDKHLTVFAEFPEKYDPLEASIQKWEFIVKHPETLSSGGMNTCGLCQHYYIEPGEYSCDLCPVAEHGCDNDTIACNNTPYADWEGLDADDPERWEFAQKEVDFLKSLRKGL